MTDVERRDEAVARVKGAVALLRHSITGRVEFSDSVRCSIGLLQEALGWEAGERDDDGPEVA